MNSAIVRKVMRFNKNPELFRAINAHMSRIGVCPFIGDSIDRNGATAQVVFSQSGDWFSCDDDKNYQLNGFTEMTLQEFFALVPTRPNKEFNVSSVGNKFVLSAEKLTVGCHTLTKADALIVANEVLAYYNAK